MQQELNYFNLAAQTSQAAYPDKSHKLNIWNPDYYDTFESNNFSGYVASDRDLVILSFRGTHAKWDSMESFRKSLSQWVTNGNFRQVQRHDYCVHKGFDSEVDSAYERILRLVKKHGGERKHIVVTGHSAGGALATLAGRRLYESGFEKCSVVTFSAPKAGDWAFSQSYPVQLLRFEAKNDPVPFFPLHPDLYDFVGRGDLACVLEFMDLFFPKFNLGALTDVEYYHSGQLLYLSHDDQLVYRSDEDIWDFLGREVENFFDSLFDDDDDYYEGDKHIISKPKEWLDFERVAMIFDALERMITAQRVDFHKDHGINTYTKFFKELAA